MKQLVALFTYAIISNNDTILSDSRLQNTFLKIQFSNYWKNNFTAIIYNYIQQIDRS